MPPTTATTFGDLLRQLRKRAGMTQGDLAAALGYSVSLICALEQNRRLPDLQAVMESYLPALGLQDEPRLAAHLIDRAAFARGEKPPAALTIKRERQLVIHEEIEESAHHLPIPPTPLLGRAQEIKQLCNRLHGHSGRLLTLVGPPGVGKTRLALAVAGEMQALYPDGAAFVSLAAVTEPSLVATALASALNLHEGAAKSPHRRLLEYLRRKELLLVLDNFEQLLPAAALVAELLSECAGLRLLVTSRERLHLRAEQRYKVPPLQLEPAVELFVQRAQAVNADCRLPPPDQMAIIEAICHCVDCLPLAIELTAARCDLFTPAALLARLTAARLELLNNGPQDLPPRQRTLTNAIAWSYQLLNGEQQQLLARLGLFSGGCAFDAAHEICGATLTDLEALVAKNLVSAETSSNRELRFSLLETIREFALLQLTTGGTLAVLQERHATWFLGLAQRVNPETVMATHPTWFTTLEVEHNNFRLALRWSLAHQPLMALALVNALYSFWEARGYLREAWQWLPQVLAATATTTTALRGYVLLHASRTGRILGEMAAAQALVEEGLALFTHLNDRAGMAEALSVQGWLFYDLHQLPAARVAFQQSHTHFTLLDNQHKMADALIGLLFSTPELHLQAAQTQSRLQEIQAIYRTLGNQRGVAFALLMQSELEGRCGNYGASTALAHDVLTIYRTLGDQRGLAGALYLLGSCLRYEKKWDAAKAACAESIQLAKQMGEIDCEMNALFHLATIERSTGQVKAACEAYQASLRLCWALKNRHIIAGCFAGMGALALLEQKNEVAATLFGAAQQVYDQLPAFLPPADLEEFAQLCTMAQTISGEAKFTQAWTIGRSWSLDAAVNAAHTFCDRILDRQF